MFAVGLLTPNCHAATAQTRCSVPPGTGLFDHLVGAADQRKRHAKPKRFGRAQIDYETLFTDPRWEADDIAYRDRCGAPALVSRSDARCFAPVYDTRQIVPPVSSAISNDPSFMTASAAGRPHTSARC
jgi:hypothetical protein